jgi:hypothetical protein
VTKTDTDPAVNLDFWASYGGAHIWNFSQKTPATDWERRIDELIVRQMAAPDPAERKRLYESDSGDLRRPSADGLFRRAAHLRRLLGPHHQRDASPVAAAAPVGAGGGRRRTLSAH